MKGTSLAIFLLTPALTLQGCKLFNDMFGPGSGSAGPKWETFTTTNSSILSNDVLSISVDVQGRKWFGTNLGVSMLNKNVWTSFSSGSPLGARQINAIQVGRDGALWFGTGGAGVFRYNQNDVQQVWRSYGITDGIPDGWIYSMAVNGYGDIWIGTNGGVGRFVQSINSSQFAGTWTTFTTDDGLPDDHVTAVAVDRDNTTWAGTSNSGLAIFNGTNWASTPLSSNYGYRVTAIAVDENNVKWISSWAGVFRFDGSAWVHFDTSNGLPSDVINCIAVGQNKYVWAGTNLGACMYNGKVWTIFNTQNSGIVSNTINAVTVDTYGNVWFGTPGGVSAYNESGVEN